MNRRKNSKKGESSQIVDYSRQSMADCSCDFCAHDNQCPYSYNETDCFVETILAAKAIVDEEFNKFLAKITEKNEGLCDDKLDVLIRYMQDIVRDSKQPLPDWTFQKERE